MRKFIFCLTILIPLLGVSQEAVSLLSISPELTKHSNSIVLEEFIEVDATDIRKMNISTKRVVAVLNKMGIQDPRTFEFYNENLKIRKIEAQVYDVMGNRKKRFKKRDFQDISRSGGSMYLDSRMVYLDYTPTFYPYIMVFESEVQTGDSGLLSDQWFLKGYAESLLKSEMRIRFNPQNKIRYKPKNLEGYDIRISETPDELILTAKNIPALKFEEYAPSKAEIFPHVLLAFKTFQLKNVVATVDDWESFGAWMNETLLGDINKVSSKTIETINRLTENEKTNEAKARKIYQYVQDKVRYVSIQIGIGGWKPMPALEVDELSYGDCKALTNYTKVLLDAAGIPSYYTIVYGNESRQDMDEDFASIQGNHVILGIPDGEEITWLECTRQDLPFGYIGSFTDDRNVVALTPEGGKLIRTKTYSSLENLQKTTAKVKLFLNGRLEAAFKSISQGLQYEDKYFLTGWKESEIDHFYKNRWNYINGFLIENYSFENNRDEISFTEHLNLVTQNYLSSVGRDFLLTPNIFNQLNYIPPNIKDRKQNLKINRGFLDEDTIEYTIPSGLKIETLPESIQIENKFGLYEINFKKLSDREFEFSRKFHLKKGEFPPEDYETYREFLKTISRLDRTKILLSRK